MNNRGSLGTTAIPLLTGFLLMGSVSSVMLEGQNGISTDANQIMNDVIDEIVTYLKIEDAIGKYCITDGVRCVERIVILIKQFIESTINMSEVKIKICGKNDVILLDYSGCAVESNSRGLFDNKIWQTINNSFGLIVILDNDRSLLDYNVMNKDKAFIAIRLPDNFVIKNGESISLSIIPAKGTTTSIVLETPSLHMSDIISFGDV